jgi:hypothetical protein
MYLPQQFNIGITEFKKGFSVGYFGIINAEFLRDGGDNASVRFQILSPLFSH